MLRSGASAIANLAVRLLWVTGKSGASLETKLYKDLVQTNVARTISPMAIYILGEVPALKSPFELTVEGAYRATFSNGPLDNPLLFSRHKFGTVGTINNKRHVIITRNCSTSTSVQRVSWSESYAFLLSYFAIMVAMVVASVGLTVVLGMFIYERFEKLNARFDSQNARFDSQNARFDSQNARFDEVTKLLGNKAK